MTANPAPPSPDSADARLARAAEDMFSTARLPPAEAALGAVLEEFGGDYQIESAEFCWIAVRRPTPSSQEVITGRTPDELLAKLRAERDGAS